MIIKKICNGPYSRGSSDFYSKHQAFYDNNDNIIEGLKINGNSDMLNTFRLPLEELSALRYNVDLSRIKSSNYFQVLHQNRLIAYSVDSGSFNEVARYTLNAIYYNNDKQIVCRLSGNDTRKINLIDTTRNIVYTDDLEGYYLAKIFNINDNRIRVVCINGGNNTILVKDYVLTNSGYLMPFKVIKDGINSPNLFIFGHSFIGKNNYDSITNTFKTYNFENNTQYTVKILDRDSDYYHLINCKQIDSTSYKILTKSNDNIQYTLAKCTIDHTNSTIYLSNLYRERLRSNMGDIYQDDYGIYRLYQGDFEIIEVDQDRNILNYKGVISKPNTQTTFYDFVNKKQIFYYQNVNKQNNIEVNDYFPFSNCTQNEESYALSDEEYYVDLIFVPDQIYYSGSNVPGIIKVAVKDINNNFVSKLVKITINNKNVAIFENNQYTITVFTSNNGYIDVNITYTDVGILDLTAEIIDTINQ